MSLFSKIWDIFSKKKDTPAPKQEKPVESVEVPKPTPAPEPIPTPTPEVPKTETKPEPEAEKPTPEVKKDTVNDGNGKAPDWSYIADNAVLDKDITTPGTQRNKEFTQIINTIKKNWAKYKTVEAATGVPAKEVAKIHYRECGLDFSGCLHNGDPWNKKTVNVPKGLGPWKSWEEAAIDAVRFDKLDKVKVWTPATALAQEEKYNGLGYRNKVGDSGTIEYSPYVAAGTNFHDETSKFTGDGKYSKTAREAQFGTLAIEIGLREAGLS